MPRTMAVYCLHSAIYNGRSFRRQFLSIVVRRVYIYICIYRWIETTKEQEEGGGDGAVRGELPHNLSGLFNRSSEKERARLRVSCFLSSFFVPI